MLILIMSDSDKDNIYIYIYIYIDMYIHIIYTHTDPLYFLPHAFLLVEQISSTAATTVATIKEEKLLLRRV